MDSTKQNIAENITALRTGRGMTQSELAEALNYSDKSVSKWERGESIPDVTVLHSIAKLFQVSLDYLIAPHDRSESSPISPKYKIKPAVARNILLISNLGIWFLSLVLFTILWEIGVPHPWIVLIAGLPVSTLTSLILNSIWDIAKVNLYLVSLLVWSILLLIYLSLLPVDNVWMVLVLGLPAQLIICLCFRFLKF